MASITIDFPDAKATQIRDILCIRGGYDPASNLTKAQFAKAYIASLIKQDIRLYLGQQFVSQQTSSVATDLEALGIS